MNRPLPPAERARRERMAAFTRERLDRGLVVLGSLVAGYRNTHVVLLPRKTEERKCTCCCLPADVCACLSDDEDARELDNLQRARDAR